MYNKIDILKMLYNDYRESVIYVPFQTVQKCLKDDRYYLVYKTLYFANCFRTNNSQWIIKKPFFTNQNQFIVRCTDESHYDLVEEVQKIDFANKDEHVECVVRSDK